MDAIFSFLKSFIKKDILDSIFLHKTVDSLWEYIPQELLDFENYGGKTRLASLKDKVFKNLNDSRELLKLWEKQEVDESKRPGKAQFTDSMFGMDGAFKKLEVD